MVVEAKKVWNKTDVAKVWLMKRDLPPVGKGNFKKADEAVTALLNDHKIRITKMSAISPKGIFFNNRSEKPSLKRSLLEARRGMVRRGIIGAKADNLFFEMDYAFKEFKDIYNKIGGAQNNFPPYLTGKKAFDDYKKDHDIFVFEDLTGKAAGTGNVVGFMTVGDYPLGSPHAKELEEDFGVKLDKNVLYIDTLAVDEQYTNHPLGKSIVNIANAYYGNIYGDDYAAMLVTGEINQTKNGKLSKLFHQKVGGFEVVAEIEAPSEKYKKRYAENYAGKGYENLKLSLLESFKNEINSN